MKNPGKSVSSILKHEIIWLALALAAVMLQAVYFSHHTDVTLDEGAYAFKGYLYVTGEYQPFQDGGPWTNKMPLSFLIPGALQALFGTGLRTARYFALLLLLAMLVALWLTARRYSGRWVALGLLGFIAVNPFFIELYSQGLSQGLVAAMLAWALELTLGKDRKPWQLITGMVLAGLIVVTRENMAPLPVILGLYLVWEQGLRRTWQALAAGVVSVGVVHAIYWPEIMRNWTAWLPGPLSSLMPAWRISLPGTVNAARLDPSFFDRLYAFWHAAYLQMPLWAGVAASWLLWPLKKTDGIEKPYRKALVSLSLLFLLLIVLHAAASVGGNYCIFCFENYVGFFAPVGWLLTAILFPFWQKKLNWLRQLPVFAVFLLLSAGWGFGSAPATAPVILNISVPRMREMRFLPGTTDLWRTLANRFDWSFDFQKYFLPTLAAVGIFLLLAFIVFGLNKLHRRRSTSSPAYILSLVVLAITLLVSPFLRLDTVTQHAPCSEDIIAAHEQTGEYMSDAIPPGSKVYWHGAPIVDLLYIPEVVVFPPQINQLFSFRIGGDPETLHRYGFWNQELAERWLQTTDYIVARDTALTGALAEAAASPQFSELPSRPPISSCRESVVIRVFRRER